MLIETAATFLFTILPTPSSPAHGRALACAETPSTLAVRQQSSDSGDDNTAKKASKKAKDSKTPKASKQPKDPSRPKKTKAEKATAKAAKLAPDEVVDPDERVDTPVRRGLDAEWKQHPSIRLGSVGHIDFEAKFQEDTRGSYQGAPLDPWELHRNRVGVKGKLFKHIEFEVERELTENELTERDVILELEPGSPWKDVNVEFTYFKNAQVQVGKFKVPFGLDQLIGVSHNDFIYRSLGANYLAPARDIGGMVHGRFFKRRLNYWSGAFQHDGDNARSKKIEGGDATFAQRFTSIPFRRDRLRGLELGTAFTISKLTDDSFRPNGLRGRTLLAQDTFYEPVYVKGRRRRWEADLDWRGGPGSARAEYTWVSDDRHGQGFGDQDLPDARARAWYVMGSWILTGEKKERPLKPDGDLLQGGFGAVEVAARYERLWYDNAGGGALEDASRTPRTEIILPESEHALTLGVNWTLNRFIKLQFNLIREHVDDPGRSPVPNGDAFWSRLFRVQLVM